MTSNERERMNWLCRRIQEEKDPKQFNALVSELNHLLDEKATVSAQNSKSSSRRNATTTSPKAQWKTQDRKTTPSSHRNL